MLFCVLSGERKYNFIIDDGTFSKRRNVTSFVGQIKKESVTSIIGRREYIFKGRMEC